MNALRLTPLIRAWIITLVAVFLGVQVADRLMGWGLVGIFGLVPESVVLRGWVWQLFSYAFVHTDLTQVLLNCLMLAFLGSELESLWGARRLALFALICSLSGGVLYLLLQVFVWGEQGLSTPMIGASGALYGLLAAYGVLFSERTLLFMMLFPMKAKHFVWVLAAVEFFTSLSTGRSGLGAAAHLGGMAAGIATLWVWARRRRASKSERPKKKASHLRLVRSSDQEEPKGPTFH